MIFNVTIVGSNSAIPLINRNPSSQLVNYNYKYFMLDCAEGTQVQMRKFAISFQKLDHILISHLHGDHYLGIFGLAFTLHLLGRKKDLHIYAHEDLFLLMDGHLKAAGTILNYKIIPHILTPSVSEVIYQDEKLIIVSVPLNHRIPTWGFVFREIEQQKKIYREFVKKHELNIDEILKVKDGGSYVNKDGVVFLNKDITMPIEPLRSYAYITDTIYDESIIPYINNVDLLYHEATFLNDLTIVASEKFHTTAEQAATIALKANAKKLIIGHFSSRYKDVNLFQKESNRIFENSFIIDDGDVFEI